MPNSKPATTSRVRGTELRDGDRVYVTGRWSVLTDIRPDGSWFRAHTDDGGELFANAASLYAVAS